MNEEVTTNKAFFIKVINVDGEIGLEFPDELMDQMDLKEGDDLLWIEENNTWRILKKKDNENE